MRKPTFCICENKDADQLRGNREADQRLCFRYIDSTIPLSKSEISSQYPSSVTAQPGLCRTRSETRMLVFSRRGSSNLLYKFLLFSANTLYLQTQIRSFRLKHFFSWATPPLLVNFWPPLHVIPWPTSSSVR